MNNKGNFLRNIRRAGWGGTALRSPPSRLDSHHWYVSPSSASFCVSSHFLCVVRATVTKESRGDRRKETWTADLDATIFNSSAHSVSVTQMEPEGLNIRPRRCQLLLSHPGSFLKKRHCLLVNILTIITLKYNHPPGQKDMKQRFRPTVWLGSWTTGLFFLTCELCFSCGFQAFQP